MMCTFDSRLSYIILSHILSYHIPYYIVSNHILSHPILPYQRYVSRRFTDNGYGYICLDFHGHGYSEGTRALINDMGDLEDDCLCLLEVLFTKSAAAPTNNLQGAVFLAIGTASKSILCQWKTDFHLRVGFAQPERCPSEL